ncbi:MAG: hypothetical protein HC851_24405 [Acaryochloris sp. RU_4_1]|nr:hypothetical protein [Acaryochloris sp. RU_4_1]
MLLPPPGASGPPATASSTPADASPAWADGGGGLITATSVVIVPLEYVVSVVVMVVPPLAHLYLASNKNPMDMIEMQEVEQTSYTMPPGVSFHKDEKGPTVFYTFSHKKLGLLGRIILHPISPTEMNVVHEVANPKGFEDARTQQKRLDIFLPLARELIERLELGLIR